MDTRAISKEEAELVISKISTVLGQEDIPVCATGAFRRGEDIADEVDIVVLLNSEEKQKWFQRWMRTLFDTHGRYTNGKGTGVINGVKLRFHPADPRADRTYTLIKPRFSFYVTTETDGRRPIGTFIAEQAQWAPAGETEPSHWALADGALFMPSDLTSEELLMQQSDKWMVYMSTAQLTKLLSTGKATDPEGAKMTRNIRFADPVNNLVMLLLGLPFILSRERNIKASALMCVIMVGAFFAFTYVCRYTQIGPYGAAFLPVLLFGPVAVVMLDAVKT